MEVKDILKEATVVEQTATFETAITAMLSGGTNTLLVTNETGVLVGEVTVADLFDAIVPDHLNGDEIMSHFGSEEHFAAAVRAAADVPISEFMSQDFSAVTPTDDLISVAATAVAHQRGRIPVVDADNRPVGIISRQGLKRIIARFLTKN